MRLLLLGLCLSSRLPAQTTASTPQPASEPSAAEVLELETFTITATGTNIRGVEPVGTAVISLSRPEIVSSGAATTEALLKTNPAIANFQALFPGNGDAGGSLAPSIHGVAEGQTLVLLNGHRLPGSGFLVTAPDPTAISPSAIQRIEVIPDGASAIYGSDAIEGVINIVLRQDMEGLETSARYGTGDGYSNYNASALFGRKWDGGSMLLSYEYTHSSALSGQDRTYFRQDRTGLGGSDVRNVVTGRVTDANGAVLAPGSLVDLAPHFDAIPEIERHNAVVSVNHKLTDALSVYGDGFFEKRDATWRVPMSPIRVSVPATNPYVASSGFGSATAPLSAAYFPGSTTNASGAEVFSVSGGGKLKLPGDWVVALDTTYGWSDSHAFFPDVNAAVAQTLANNTSLATALNPFGPTPAAVFDQVTTYAHVAPDVQQSLFDTVLKADGTVFSLPGGESKVALGAGYREENYEATNRSGALSNPLIGRADVTRRVSSVFAEWLVPVVGPNNERAGLRRLNLSLSARRDHYSDFGDTTNPKIGVAWSIVRGLDLRGSWGKSFHAPRLSDIGVGVDTRLIPFNFFLFGNSFPPVFSARPANMVIIAGGTLGLKPERAETWSAGFDFKPAGIDGLKLSATFYDITFKDKVAVVFRPDFNNPGDNQFWQANLTAAQTQELYSRFPQIPGASYPAQIAYLADVRRFNLGSTWTNGVDTDMQYRWSAAGSKFEVGAAANFVTGYRIQQTAGAEVRSYLDTNRAIRSKIRGRFAWSYKQSSATLWANRTDGYLDTNTTQKRVDPWTTLDLHLGYDFNREGWLKNTSVALDVTNLLDEDPPFVDLSNDSRTSAGTGAFGFDQTNATPVGRVIALSVRRTF